MNCPVCGHGDHRVLRTDEMEGVVRRSRECLKCAGRWRTIEAPEMAWKRAEEAREALRFAIQAVGEE